MSIEEKDVCAIAAGNNAAFCRVYDRYKDAMYRYAYSILKDRYASEDIVHDALICIMQNAHKYIEGNERAWIMRIVHNLSVNYLKSNSRIVPIEEISYREEDTESSFYEIMDLVPEKTDRQIVVLKIDMGFKIKEIAALLGMTQNAVSKRYRRTLKELGEILKSAKI